MDWFNSYKPEVRAIANLLGWLAGLLAGFCLLWVVIAGRVQFVGGDPPSGGSIPGMWGSGGTSLDLYEWRVLLVAFWVGLSCGGLWVLLHLLCALIPWPKPMPFDWD
ncbi:MAG: hypothetical protein AAF797_08630 [Planctomycetota bacterium]